MARRYAFTMAEILLSLTIIGVVAAITLPSLTGNINERTWNTQRKALYARMSQAFALMPALNGFGTVSGVGTSSAIDTAAETFVASGLSKVLKINNICDNTHFQDCGIVSSYTNLMGTQKTMPTTLNELHSTLVSRAAFNVGTTSYAAFSQNDTKAIAFETQNGESVALFYNPTCKPYMEERGTALVFQSKMCVNMVFDLNGSKGPNTVGKDIGILAVYYPSDSMVVTAVPYAKDGNNGISVLPKEASKICTDMDSEIRLPNQEELATMYINKDFIGKSGGYWTSTRVDFNRRMHIDLSNGIGGLDSENGSNKYKVLCIKR